MIRAHFAATKLVGFAMSGDLKPNVSAQLLPNPNQSITPPLSTSDYSTKR
jgi:hypothetical protein